jgi:hypothetical protein
MNSKMQGTIEKCGLEVIEPLDLFRDNYESSNLSDLGTAKSDSTRLDGYRSTMEKLKKQYLTKCEKAESAEEQMRAFLDSPSQAEKKTDLSFKTAMKLREAADVATYEYNVAMADFDETK